MDSSDSSESDFLDEDLPESSKQNFCPSNQNYSNKNFSFRFVDL